MLFGNYEVMGQLGAGACGTVLRVRARDGRELALKRLERADPHALARFDRERRIQAALGADEGFVPLLDAGAVDGHAFLVMPLLEGGTLADRIARGPLEPEAARALGIRLARALGRAHARGVIHRDFKPSNVLFTADGAPLIADLGLAKHFRRDVSGASASASFTQRGFIAGTVMYMPIEQATDAASAGPPADVFALGAVLYHCLVGEPPFAAETSLMVLERLEHGSFARLRERRPDLDERLLRAVDRALARSPEDRWRDGEEMARALEGRATEEPRGSRGATSRAVVAVALGALLVLGVGGLVAATRGTPRTPPVAVSLPPPPKAPPKPPALLPPSPDPPSPDGEPRDVAGYLERSKKRRIQGDDAGALADAKRATEVGPGHHDAWERVAGFSVAAGDNVTAIRAATRALELDLKCAMCWNFKGAAHSSLQEHETGIHDLTQAIALSPHTVAYWVNRSQAHFRGKDGPRAVDDAAVALKIRPNNVDALLAHGVALRITGDDVAATADFERVLQLNRTDRHATEMARQHLAAIKAKTR